MAAFEQLFQKHDKRVFSIATHYAQNSEDAKDIYQEVFIRVYHGLSKFQFRSEFSTWLHRVVVNVCLSHLKRERVRRHRSLDENNEPGGTVRREGALQSESRTDHETLNTEVLTHIGQILDTLPPRQRMVFTLRHIDGFKLREIATTMKCSNGSVKKLLFLATKRMRETLKEFEN